MRGLDKLATAPADAKLAAIPLLDGIDCKTFPYAPTSLMWRKAITADPAKNKEIDELLKSRFADSIEYLAAQAESLTNEQWHELKNNPPVTRGPRPKPVAGDMR